MATYGGQFTLTLLLAACQANYIRDVQGGTVSPSSSAELTGLGG
ncbi:TPA: colicin release lysis protein [Escherichia coli]